MVPRVLEVVRAVTHSSSPRRRAAAAVLMAVGVSLAAGSSPASATPGCDATASPSTFSSAVAAAASGQTICLATGNYGAWGGTNKAIIVTAAPGATPQMTVNFGSGDSGFTLEHMTGMGGCISGGASNITLQYNVFADGTNSCGGGNLTIQGAVTNIIVNANDLTYPVQSTASGANSKIFLDTVGATPGAAATIENNSIENGDLDGVHIGDGSGDLIAGNTFANLCDRGVNHTDNIQFEAGTQITVQGNYVYEPQSCPTQGITSYDGDTRGLLIEDNVVDIPRDWGIELYSDQGSVVVHNTVVWHPKSYSEFNSGTGQIDIDRKSQDPAGTGTHVYDNIAIVDFANGSTGTADHNASGQSAVYVGPLATWAGYKLSPRSPVGLKAATDGLDDGARIAVPAPAPSTSPSPVPAPVRGSAPSRRRRGALVLSLGFGERSGATVIDTSGWRDNGRLHGVGRTRAGRHGRGLSAGPHGDVVVRNSHALDLTNGMTLAAWVRPTARGSRWRSVIVKQGNRRRTAYGLFASDQRGRVAAFVTTRSRHSLHTRVRLALRRWTYLAMTYNGHVLRVYVDGRLKAAQRVAGTLRPGGGPVTIGGGGSPGGAFTGVIDDVRAWRTALSPEAIRAQMRANASA